MSDKWDEKAREIESQVLDLDIATRLWLERAIAAALRDQDQRAAKFRIALDRIDWEALNTKSWANVEAICQEALRAFEGEGGE